MIETALSDTETSVFAQVIRFEDRFAVLRMMTSFDTDDDIEMLWPIKNLPDQTNLGDKVRLDLSTSISREQDRDIIARKILEEIIK